MRLGRLAAAGLATGAVMAFAISLLRPRRRLVDAVDDPPGPDTPDLGETMVPRETSAGQRRIDVTATDTAGITTAGAQ